MRRRAVDFRIILDHDPVLNDGNSRGRDLRVAVEFCRREKYVVRLPISCWRTRVNERRRLAVDGTAGAVGIIINLEGIENLDLIRA